MAVCFRDSKSFNGLTSSAGEQKMDSTGPAHLGSVTGNELRLGKFCMINGFPCKIRELHWAKTGKHGHAKLRVVGISIFDGKKRETIFIAQHPVLVPTVEAVSAVRCVMREDGFLLAEHNEVCRLPHILSFSDDNASELGIALPKEGEHANLSITMTCGHYKITGVRIVAPPSASNGDFEERGTLVEKDAQQRSAVLSRKELRKHKKLMLQQQRVTSAAASVNQTIKS